MITAENLKEFGLDNSIYLLKSFALSNWGTTIVFQILYGTDELSLYEVKLINCDVMRWSAHFPEDAEEEIGITDIHIISVNKYRDLPTAINIPCYSIDNNNYVFTMLTIVFEIMVIYKTIEVKKLSEDA